MAPPAIAALCLARRHRPAAAAALGLAGFVAWFLRDPDRQPPITDHALAPADGRVVRIATVHDRYFDQEMLELSIFLALWNVHIQRAPVAGRVLHTEVVAGPRRPALYDDAAHNHRHAIYMQTPLGPCVVTLMAGLMARRIVRWVEAGEELRAGQRIGLIKFGSRVSLRLPADAQPLVRVGQEVRAGLTPLAARPPAR
jgi:phosphatidylserine decarboxylase